MRCLSIEDIIEHLYFEEINLNRKQLESLINLFDPNTSELIAFDERIKGYIIRHLFNKTQRERYYSKRNNYLFAEIVMSCII